MFETVCLVRPDGPLLEGLPLLGGQVPVRHEALYLFFAVKAVFAHVVVKRVVSESKTSHESVVMKIKLGEYVQKFTLCKF